MARKPQPLAVGDEIEMIGEVNRTVDRDDGLLVAVRLARGELVTVHERWLERIDPDTPVIVDGESVKVRGVVRRTGPVPSMGQREGVTVQIDGSTVRITVGTEFVTATGRRR